MTTAANHILAYLRDYPGPQRIGNIAATFEGTRDAIYVAASDLYRTGGIVRAAPGVYVLPDGAVQAVGPGAAPAEPAALAPAPKPRKHRQKPVALQEAESTTEPELGLAAWHTGELTVRRGDQVVLLSPAEVETLMRFAGRMLRVEE